MSAWQRGNWTRAGTENTENSGKEVSPLDIQSAQAQHEEQLMQLPNVTGVGTGEKGGKPVIVVFVTQKVPASQLQPDEIVPQTIEGYETDVRESGVLTAQGQ